MTHQKRIEQYRKLGLGLLRGPEVILADHNSQWAEAFHAEKTFLLDSLHIPSLSLFHIGSTSIPGIVAKPILDILGGVDSLQAIDSHKAVFEKLGYEFKGEHGIPGRRYCVLYSDDKETSYVHLHIFEKSHRDFYRHLVFAHYLRNSKTALQEYEQLKFSLIREKKLIRAAYSEAKNDVVQKLQSEAEALWPLIKKVVIYALRKREQLEVLVFDHVKYPEVSPQLPSGTVEEKEDVLEAAKRELFEESGIQTTSELKFIGNYTFFKEYNQQFHDRHIFVFNCENLPEKWIHTVTGTGDDQHLEFKYYWLPVAIAQSKLQANLGDGFRIFQEKIGEI